MKRSPATQIQSVQKSLESNVGIGRSRYTFLFNTKPISIKGYGREIFKLLTIDYVELNALMS